MSTLLCNVDDGSTGNTKVVMELLRNSKGTLEYSVSDNFKKSSALAQIHIEGIRVVCENSFTCVAPSLVRWLFGPPDR